MIHIHWVGVLIYAVRFQPNFVGLVTSNIFKVSSSISQNSLIQKISHSQLVYSFTSSLLIAYYGQGTMVTARDLAGTMTHLVSPVSTLGYLIRIVLNSKKKKWTLCGEMEVMCTTYATVLL